MLYIKSIMLKNIGLTELLIIGGICILIFGASKISNLAKNLGETTKELKKVKREYESDEILTTISKKKRNVDLEEKNKKEVKENA